MSPENADAWIDDTVGFWHYAKYWMAATMVFGVIVLVTSLEGVRLVMVIFGFFFAGVIMGLVYLMDYRMRPLSISIGAEGVKARMRPWGHLEIIPWSEIWLIHAPDWGDGSLTTFDQTRLLMRFQIAEAISDGYSRYTGGKAAAGWHWLVIEESRSGRDVFIRK